MNIIPGRPSGSVTEQDGAPAVLTVAPTAYTCAPSWFQQPALELERDRRLGRGLRNLIDNWPLGVSVPAGAAGEGGGLRSDEAFGVTA